ncbi:hypothetical protein CSKR_101820 [Clonorchis sinensis]|uniref:Uncharacterized protein n=1 Tax=Clonorchis sinensis TaxID=79923 RepID=A0A419QCC3_CLOSI|nr:hypothetical protein CSKR_101820 [Clonorchis sinensis]
MMNLFERFNNRFGRNAAPARPERESEPADQRPPADQVAASSSAQVYETVYEFNCPEEWVRPGTQPSKHLSATLSSGAISTRPREMAQDVSGIPHVSSTNTLHRTKANATTLTSQSRRAKTPLGSFYNVSSDEDDGSDDDAGEEAADESEPTPAGFERRSLRMRRSLNKAKAALPADFADRIGVAPEMTDSMFREQSCSRAPRVGTGRAEGISGDGSIRNQASSSDDDDLTDPVTSNAVSGKSKTLNLQADGTAGGHQHTSLEPDDINSSSTVSSKGSISSPIPFGVQWSTEPFRPLEELMPEFRDKPPGSTYLLKTISQRSGCRCALCGHDSLLLFPVLNASLASGYWGSWSVAGKGHGRIGQFERGPSYQTTNIEIHTRLVLFRQCRGWYEVLNESQQPIPHLTTVEQMRRAKPSTFLVRRELRCLAAPATLLIPPLKETRPNGDGPTSSPFPPSLLALASSPETLVASIPENIPAGTLMHYITYLPHCSLKRGRKMKELGLILATRRAPGSPVRRSKLFDDTQESVPTRAYYIGLEDSTPAVFPVRFSLSPVAGPENISGVHSLASIFRKFRLPLAVRPVCVSDQLTDLSATDRILDGQGLQQSNVNTSSIHCGLTALQGISFGDQSFLRLEFVYRSDVLIISPVSSPDRLFLITPSMLPDHLFQLGTSNDPAYLRLLENHRIQATNFLAVAHPKDSLNYLVRHMQDVTREPRDSYTTRELYRAKRSVGSTNVIPELQMTQEEIYRAYDELDDIYFYIRHGYYPSKNRRPENIKSETTQSSNKSSGEYIGPPTQLADTTEVSLKKITPDNNVTQPRVGMPTAEELLAASLSSPVRGQNHHSKWTNGRTGALNMGSTYHVQPKEYGI